MKRLFVLEVALLFLTSSTQDLDPFAPSTHEALLAKLPPLTGVHGYVSIGGAVPNVRCSVGNPGNPK